MLSIIIASLALLFSIYTYVIHDRKLKKQELLMNEYRLKALQQEETDKKKAIIRAEAYPASGGKRTLFISNAGKAKAKNLSVSLEKTSQVYDTRPRLPITYTELLPNAYREVTLFLSEGDKIMTLQYTWEDDFSKDNKETQTIDL